MWGSEGTQAAAVGVYLEPKLCCCGSGEDGPGAVWGAFKGNKMKPRGSHVISVTEGIQCCTRTWIWEQTISTFRTSNKKYVGFPLSLELVPSIVHSSPPPAAQAGAMHGKRCDLLQAVVG